MSLILRKARNALQAVRMRSFHRTPAVLSKDEFDEEKFLQEEKPWENYSCTWGFGIVPDPQPILEKRYDEPHGEALIPVFWALLFLGIIPVSIYAWYKEYQHLVVHRHRRPFPKYDFLHAKGPRKLPFGDGKHTALHNPYWNFLSEGYETDKDGNFLPPGEYAME